MVEAGLAGHAGFTALGDTESVKRLAADTAYETAQCYLNVLNPSGIRPGADGGEQDFDGLINFAAGHGKGVIAIRVYAAGALTAAEQRHPVAGEPPPPLVPGAEYAADVERARRLEGIRIELGLDSILELGLRFALAAPGVSTVLVGLSSYEQLEAALRWTERGPLHPDHVDGLLDLA